MIWLVLPFNLLAKQGIFSSFLQAREEGSFKCSLAGRWTYTTWSPRMGTFEKKGVNLALEGDQVIRERKYENKRTR